jgi:hypothetical protein
MSVGVTTTTLNAASVTVPLARYLRWRINGGAGVWAVHFRVWVSVSS